MGVRTDCDDARAGTYGSLFHRVDNLTSLCVIQALEEDVMSDGIMDPELCFHRLLDNFDRLEERFLHF